MITLSVDSRVSVTSWLRRLLYQIDPDGRHLTANCVKDALAMLSHDTQIVFLSIAMPDEDSMNTARLMQQEHHSLNIIFLTDDTQYPVSVYSVYPSGLLTNPASEQDIRRELRHLRFPLSSEQKRLWVRCRPFGVFVDNYPFGFQCDKTIELFAYLVYKNGAFATNGELLGILWDGNPNKAVRLRQLIMDMRACLQSVGAGQMIVKKYGKIALDMSHIVCDGVTDSIAEEYNWY